VSKNADLAFCVNQAHNWKKAEIQNTPVISLHTTAVLSHQTAKAPITAQLSVHHRQQQVKSRNSLPKISECIWFLDRQVLALRATKTKKATLKSCLAVINNRR